MVSRRAATPRAAPRGPFGVHFPLGRGRASWHAEGVRAGAGHRVSAAGPKEQGDGGRRGFDREERCGSARVNSAKIACSSQIGPLRTAINRSNSVLTGAPLAHRSLARHFVATSSFRTGKCSCFSREGEASSAGSAPHLSADKEAIQADSGLARASMNAWDRSRPSTSQRFRH